MGLNVHELRKHTELIRQMQSEIEADERHLGYHTSYERDAAQLAADARHARAERILKTIMRRHKHLKPARMHWADYIMLLAARARERKRQGKLARTRNSEKRY